MKIIKVTVWGAYQYENTGYCVAGKEKELLTKLVDYSNLPYFIKALESPNRCFRGAEPNYLNVMSAYVDIVELDVLGLS